MTGMNPAQWSDVQDLIERALVEDVGPGDVTTQALVPDDVHVYAVIVAREPCIVAGCHVAAAVFTAVDPQVACHVLIEDGAAAGPDEAIVALAGPAAAILTAERTALNFMQRLTGTATLTRRFVDKSGPSGARILDTRKTTPTLRVLEKYAVRCGGGENHRHGLFDRVLIKDNHRRFWHETQGEPLDGAVRRARTRNPGLTIEVEVESEADLETVLKADPDWVLLDNMTPAQLRRCVTLCAGRCRLEASGGINLDNIAEVAATGVDAVSLGCLTHSAAAADLSLEFNDYDKSRC